MALLSADGFENYNDKADFDLTYPNNNLSDTYLSFPLEDRNGGRCMKWDCDHTYLNQVWRMGTSGWAVSQSINIFGFAFKCGLNDNGAGSTLTLPVTGSYGGMSIQFNPRSTTATVRRWGVSQQIIGYFEYAYDTWQYLEVKLKISNSGIIQIRLNEQTVIDWTGDNYYQNETFPITFSIALHDDQLWWFDDFYRGNDQGSYNNDFLGDIRIDVINPNGAGNYTDLTPSTGNNYECVDETLLDDSDYVEGINVGDKDSYSYPVVPTDIDDAGIKAVMIKNHAQKTAEANNIKIDALLRTGSTDYNSSAAQNLSDGEFSPIDFIFEKDPSDSNPWTQAKINACEFGMEVP